MSTAAVLALAAPGVLLAGVAALRAFRARRRPACGPALDAICEGLGDAVLIVDAAERIASANRALAALAGAPGARLARAPVIAVLGEDVAVLARSAARAPASGEVRLPAIAGSRRARAVAVRLEPGRTLVVVRPLGPPRPPPLPACAPPPAPARRAEAHADLGAVSAALRGPVSRVATSTSLLRLVLPGGAPALDEVTRLEAAVAELERRLAALLAAGGAGAGARRPVDVAALLAELAAGPAAIPVHVLAAPARALVDEGRLRAALRELLRAGRAALRPGGALTAAVTARRGDVVVELRCGEPLAGAELEAIARALLGAEGGRVEVEAVPGRGAICRIALPAAAPAAPAVPV